MERVTACPTCRSAMIRSIFPPDLWCCRACGILFRNPRPCQRDILRYYDRGGTFDRWQLDLPVRRQLWKKRLDLILSYKSGGTLLDIGTGDGFFLPYAAQYFAVEATEVSARGVAYSTKRGYTPQHGLFSELDFGGQRYDLITLWHVLEHLREPGATLQKIRQLLTPDGLLVVAVPNETVPLVRGRMRRQHPFGPFQPGQEIHLIHFVPSSFKRILRWYGYSICRFGVDDVHLQRSVRSVSKYKINQGLNCLLGWHFDTAMYAICSLAPDERD